MRMPGARSHSESPGPAGSESGGLELAGVRSLLQKRGHSQQVRVWPVQDPIGFCTPSDSFLVVCSLLVCSMFTKLFTETAEWIEFRQFFHKCRNLHPCRNLHAERPVAAGLQGNSGDRFPSSTKAPMADSEGCIAPGSNGIVIPFPAGECGREPARESGTLEGCAFLPAIWPIMTGGFRATVEVSRGMSCRRR